VIFITMERKATRRLPAIILASSSPRRRWLLRRLGVRFKVVRPRVFEKLDITDPLKYVRTAARLKARAVAERAKGIIVGVDTVVVLGRRILGKPRSRADARAMLRLLSGRTHRVLSALIVLDSRTRRQRTAVEETTVRFRKLTSREIEAYIRTPEPYDKAGAYGIQGRAGLFVKSINGCYWNVVGLPVTKLLTLLNGTDPY